MYQCQVIAGRRKKSKSQQTLRHVAIVGQTALPWHWDGDESGCKANVFHIWSEIIKLLSSVWVQVLTSRLRRYCRKCPLNLISEGNHKQALNKYPANLMFIRQGWPRVLLELTGVKNENRPRVSPVCTYKRDVWPPKLSPFGKTGDQWPQFFAGQLVNLLARGKEQNTN